MTIAKNDIEIIARAMKNTLAQEELRHQHARETLRAAAESLAATFILAGVAERNQKFLTGEFLAQCGFPNEDTETTRHGKQAEQTQAPP